MVVTSESPTLAARPAVAPVARSAAVARPDAGAAGPALRRWVGLLGLLVAVGYLAAVVDAARARRRAGGGRPTTRPRCSARSCSTPARSWCGPGPGGGCCRACRTGQSWAALHVSLLGNHVLPFRLGEALRVTSVLRRTALPTAPVAASAVALRAADLLAVLALAAVAAPAVAGGFGVWGWLLAAAAARGRGRRGRLAGRAAPARSRGAAARRRGGAGRARSPGCWRPR